MLDWGFKNISLIFQKKKKARVKLVNSDVLSVRACKQDVICATNFSYWHFTERSLLSQYFKSVRQSLNPDGALILDFYGGLDATKKLHEDPI